MLIDLVHKQQKARQMNDGTFERRIHQGVEGGRDEEEQGELFGTHNIFKFDPRGFVADNVSRCKHAEIRSLMPISLNEYNWRKTSLRKIS